MLRSIKNLYKGGFARETEICSRWSPWHYRYCLRIYRRLRISRLRVVPFVIFHFIGRIGCFLGGCCYGRVTDSIFGVYFPDIPDSGIYHHGQKLFPTQLFEAIGLVGLAIALHFVKRDKFPLYLIAYAVLRFCLEFLRDDDRGTTVLGISPSQLIAISVLVVTIAYLIIKRVKGGGVFSR